MLERSFISRVLTATLVCIAFGAHHPAAMALFDDNEARKAIVDLRQQASKIEQRLARLETVTQGQVALAQQINEKDREIAKLRNDLEVAMNAIRKLQEDNRTLYASLDARIKQIEPKKLEVDGQEISVAQTEAASYQAALDQFKAGQFAQAISSFQAHIARHPKGSLDVQARYFLGSAQFATGEYKAALVTQRDVAKDYPDHPRAADALLSMASAQLELKAIQNAKKTLNEIVNKYPGTAAANAAKARLDALK